MPLRHATVSLIVLAAVAASVDGCGGGDSPAQSSAHPGGAAQRKPDSVSIANFKFSPASRSVGRGTRITVANRDSTAHTATADDGHSFDTGNLDPGASATITLSRRGTFKYHCSIHPFMHGVIVVS